MWGTVEPHMPCDAVGRRELELWILGLRVLLCYWSRNLITRGKLTARIDDRQSGTSVTHRTLVPYTRGGWWS
jgi:hypothetical protein